MLRVRPVHFTSRLDQWEQLLTELGMVKTVDDGPWKEYDAGSGRLALHAAGAGSAEDGTTSFGVEVGDLAEFARRTSLAGDESGSTTAELITADHGESCRITGRDGFTFLADPGAREVNGSGADAAVTVVGVWFTADPGPAAMTLQDIGARFRPVPDADETADFTAKNGGVLMVRPAEGAPRAGLGFEYDGDLDALHSRLTGAGHQVRLTEEAFGRTLHVASPDASGESPASIWVSKR